MELGLYQKQTLNLVMTQELRQAISLLQYSTLDLSQFIQEQAIENPLIELEDRNSDIHYEERYTTARSKSYKNRSNEMESPLEFIANEEAGLQENLLEQIKWASLTEEQRSVLHYLILNLDENGYLPMTNQEISAQLCIDSEEVEQYVQILQTLDPLGVGARDLKECLNLQAQEYYPDEPILLEIISHYLEELSEKKWKKLSKIMGVSLQEIGKIAASIQTLDPRPCSNLTNSATSYLYPDITVEKDNGEYIIAMNDGYIPRIHVNQQYMGILNTKSEGKSYVRDNYQKYLWLIRSIEQRRSTILKITTYIVNTQRGFLENGFSSLQPMTLKDVAEVIEMHESTVSRAVSNKVIQTPVGSFEMKQLFTSKLDNIGGGDTSSAKVKILLEDLIDGEDKWKPYSDQKIATFLLKQHGITVSRRTVAKYRDELNIVSSSKRKRIV